MIYQDIYLQLTSYEVLSLIINFLVALGTIGAVSFSLYITIQRKKIKYKIDYGFDKNNDVIWMSILNLNPERPIYLSELRLKIDDKLIYKGHDFYKDNKRYLGNDTEDSAIYGIKIKSSVYLSSIFYRYDMSISKDHYDKLLADLVYKSGDICIVDHSENEFCSILTTSELEYISKLRNKRK